MENNASSFPVPKVVVNIRFALLSGTNAIVLLVPDCPFVRVEFFPFRNGRVMPWRALGPSCHPKQNYLESDLFRPTNTSP